MFVADATGLDDLVALFVVLYGDFYRLTLTPICKKASATAIL
jgi:hypothetical protein